MRVYYEIGVRSFRRATTYRSAYIAGLLTNAFFGAVLSYMYLGIYGAGGVVAGFSAHDAVSYVWTTQSLISVGAGWLSWDIAATIRTGEVINDMTRPWSFYGYWLSRTLGERVFNLLMRGSLTYLIGFLYFDTRLPAPNEMLGFLAAIMLSMLVSFAFAFIVNMSGFWLLDAMGAIGIASTLLMFFSGFLLPLAFFPPFLATIARVLPFRAIAGLPAEIFLGQINGIDVVYALSLQLFWAVVLTAIALLVQRAAMRKVVIQGG